MSACTRIGDALLVPHCCDCQKEFKTWDLAKKHAKKCKSKSLHQTPHHASSAPCPQCGKVLVIHELKRHIKYCSGKRPQSLTECWICGERIPVNDYQEHEWSHYKGETNMLKSPSSGGQQGGQQKQGQQRQGVNYLRETNLPAKDAVRAKITSVKANVGNNDAVVKIVISGTPYLLGLRSNQPNFATMYEAFGSDENDWVGKEIMLANVWDEFAERNYVTVTEAPAKEVKGPEKAKR